MHGQRPHQKPPILPRLATPPARAVAARAGCANPPGIARPRSCNLIKPFVEHWLWLDAPPGAAAVQRQRPIIIPGNTGFGAGAVHRTKKRGTLSSARLGDASLFALARLADTGRALFAALSHGR